MNDSSIQYEVFDSFHFCFNQFRDCNCQTNPHKKENEECLAIRLHGCFFWFHSYWCLQYVCIIFIYFISCSSVIFFRCSSR